MRIVIYSLLVFLAAGPAHAATYKWVDEDGKVHYSDSPPPGVEAQAVDLPELLTIPAPPAAGPRPQPAPPAAPEGPPYELFAITAPAPDETFLANDGRVTVSLTVSPLLQPGHAVVILLDGAPAAGPDVAASVTLSGVERGTHAVQAAIVDDRSQVVQSSVPVTFHVRQTVVKNPVGTTPPPKKGNGGKP